MIFSWCSYVSLSSSGFKSGLSASANSSSRFLFSDSWCMLLSFEGDSAISSSECSLRISTEFSLFLETAGEAKVGNDSCWSNSSSGLSYVSVFSWFISLTVTSFEIFCSSRPSSRLSSSASFLISSILLLLLFSCTMFKAILWPCGVGV